MNNAGSVKKDRISIDRWYVKLLVILLSFLPVIAQVQFNPADTTKVINEALSNPLAYQSPIVFGIIKVSFVILLCLVILRKQSNISSIFFGFSGAALVYTGIFQSMSNTRDYGFVIVISNLILICFTGILWIVLGIKKNCNYVIKRGTEIYFLMPLALLAFIFPVDSSGRYLSFNLYEVLLNESMVTFCMLAPVILFVAVAFVDKVNLKIIRFTAFSGIYFGILNMATWFFLSRNIWMGVLHIPLLVISLYTYIITHKKQVKLESGIPAASQ